MLIILIIKITLITVIFYKKKNTLRSLSEQIACWNQIWDNDDRVQS